MYANETKVQNLIEGTKQYVIPLFQRTYSWTKKEWEILWNDIIELCEMEIPRTHFIGSIVNLPTVSVPEGVTKYLLIDGQQRLTTIFILLILLRNIAKQKGNNRFADEINNTLLVNQYKYDLDYYKLMPTQIDRNAYQNLINQKTNNEENNLYKAYSYFEKKINQVNINHEKIKQIITNYFSVVSIVLDKDDNPYLVFESLNAKGRPLTQADLIRNYFFMRIHVNNQEEIYNKYWLPMQNALNESLTEFLRHFLMKDGQVIKQDDIYYVLKEKVNESNALQYLAELKKYSNFYQKFKFPEYEEEPKLQKMFERLNRIEVTTAYPLLLNIYNIYSEKVINIDEFVEILKIIENYLIRRFVCNIPSNQLNKIFPSIYSIINSKYNDNIINGLKTILQTKGYPKDNEFYFRFKETKFYGAGDRLIKTKLILETIESSYNHKESVAFENLTVEHIMPQTLSEWWKEHLGEDWEDTHELLLHTIGNLTLTAYNSELSNCDFFTKKEKLSDSHLELNKYFTNIDKWTKTEIENRCEFLANKALEIWRYFGDENFKNNNFKEDVTGTTPLELKILGQHFKVKSWRDVLEQTLNVIYQLEPEKFEVLAQNFSKYIGKDKSKFRDVRRLQNNYYIEVHLSAQYIRRLCYKLIETIDLTSDEWEVII